MPGLITAQPFSTIRVRELHPTFAAEIEGVNFQDLGQEQFDEIRSALAKVSLFRLC